MLSAAAAAKPSDFVTDATARRNILYDALSQDKLELILFPTEKCNFRCTYCYEDFAIGRMPPAVVTGIKNLIEARSTDLKTLHLSWFGGEPLVAYDIVRDISAHAKRLSDERGFQSIVSITTNGYTLTEGRFVELAELGTRKFQLSLDGEKAVHDRTRLRIDGAGTFAKIWSNILIFNRLFNEGRVSSARIILRIHVHPENVDSVRELIARIRSELNPLAFSVHFKNVGHWGGKNDADFEIFDTDAAYRRLQAELHEALSEFKPEFVDEVYVCYASKANSFTIRADGTVGKCTVALKSSANIVGRISEDGRLNLDAEKYGAWLHSLSSMNKDDLGCPIFRLPKALELPAEAARPVEEARALA
jgi:uncharacterized protein